jgi:hypothetical protein
MQTTDVRFKLAHRQALWTIVTFAPNMFAHGIYTTARLIGLVRCGFNLKSYRQPGSRDRREHTDYWRMFRK